MRKAALLVVVMAPALVLTGCKSSTNKAKVVAPQVKISAVATAASTAPAATTAPASPTLPPPPAPASSASPTSTPSASITGSASPTNLDPCQLVTQTEASTIAGATFGPGEEETTGGGGKICVYGSETTNVFRLEVAQGDPNTAPAQFDQGLAQAEATIESALPPGASVPLGVQDLDASSSSSSGSSAPIGDKAVGLVGSETIAGKSINFTGIYVLSGGTFIFIGDLVLSRASPPLSAMEDQARVALSRI